jgi:hypothetical protein
MIIATRFRELPDEDMKHIVDLIEAGKPVVGLRTATHAFQYTRNRRSPFAKYSYNNREFRGGLVRDCRALGCSRPLPISLWPAVRAMLHAPSPPSSLRSPRMSARRCF